MRSWHLRENIEMRAPASVTQLKAMMSLALSCGWWRVALMMWLAFHALLGPGEFFSLTWCHVRYIKELR